MKDFMNLKTYSHLMSKVAFGTSLVFPWFKLHSITGTKYRLNLIYIHSLNQRDSVKNH